LALVALPESLSVTDRTTRLTVRDLNPVRPLLEAARRPGMTRLIGVFALLTLALTLFASTIPVLALDALGWGPIHLGGVLSAVGLVDIIVQGVLLGVLIRLVGARGVMIGGLVGLMGACIGLVLVGSLVPASWLLVAASLLFATAEGATTATLQGVLSTRV